MHGVELRRAAVQDADEVDHRIAAAHEPRQRHRVVRVGLHDVDVGQHAQVAGMREPPRGHPGCTPG
ncbi:MAG: hypothetical protein U1F49_13815 [Rubrivivax sp.]